MSEDHLAAEIITDARGIGKKEKRNEPDGAWPPRQLLAARLSVILDSGDARRLKSTGYGLRKREVTRGERAQSLDAVEKRISAKLERRTIESERSPMGESCPELRCRRKGEDFMSPGRKKAFGSGERRYASFWRKERDAPQKSPEESGLFFSIMGR